MRTPVPIEPTDRPPIPATREMPDPKFIDDLCMAIRAGARPGAAARWLGVPYVTWRLWYKRRGEPYETLRARVRAAVAHLEVKLMSELAKKNPGEALKNFRRHASPSPDRARFVARQAKEKPWEILDLTLAEELFCREVAADPQENGVQAIHKVNAALTEAGLSTFAAQSDGGIANLASNLRKKPKIITRIDQIKREMLAMVERKKRTKMTGEMILEKLTSIATANVRDVVTVDEHGMTVKNSAEWTDEASEAIDSVENTREGVKVRFHSKTQALDVLSRYYFPQSAVPPDMNIQRAIVILPPNNRERLAITENGEGSTNGHPTHRAPESAAPRATIDFPPRDGEPHPDG